jgi:hypothetical protein
VIIPDAMAHVRAGISIELQRINYLEANEIIVSTA